MFRGINRFFFFSIVMRTLTRDGTASVCVQSSHHLRIIVENRPWRSKPRGECYPVDAIQSSCGDECHIEDLHQHPRGNSQKPGRTLHSSVWFETPKVRK